LAKHSGSGRQNYIQQNTQSYRTDQISTSGEVADEKDCGHDRSNDSRE
jgi:hypothetical protein